MSQLLFYSGGNFIGQLQDNEDRLHQPNYSNYLVFANYPSYGAMGYGFSTSDFRWSRSRGPGMHTDGTASIIDTQPTYYQFYRYSLRRGGSQSRTIVTGNVYYANGVSAANVTVKLVDTPTGIVVDTTLSDTAGFYVAGSPYSTNAQAQGYLSGGGATNDQAGSTVNTLPA